MKRGGDTVIEDGLYIEGFLIQPQLNRIASNEQVVQVQPKIMQVLVCLIEQPGKVVTRQRLFEVVWAETNVTEHVLSRSISELRKIFNDDARNPRVIETIPKTGYRLIAPVVWGSEAAEETGDSEPAAASEVSASAAGQPESSAPKSNAPKSNAPKSSVPKSRAPLWVGLVALAAVLALLLYALGLFSRHTHFHLH